MFEELIDAAARLQALSVDKSFHVESPAGAGKTSLLTARFIRLLAVVDHPYQILALTFTNKAASEMRERISSILCQAEDSCSTPSPWIKDLLPHAQEALKRHKQHADLLKSPDGLRIMTFHSFCNLLAVQAPCEAGIPLGASIAAEEDQTALLTEAVRTMQRELFSSSPDDQVRMALERRLLHLNNDWPALEAELVELVRNRELLRNVLEEVRSAPERDHLAGILGSRLRSFISYRLAELKQSFAGTDLGRNWKSLCSFLGSEGAAAAQKIPPTLPGTNSADLAAWQAVAELCLTKSGTLRKRFTSADGFCKGFEASSWGKCVKSLPPSATRLLSSIRELPGPDYPPFEIDPLFDLVLLVSKAIEAHGSLCRRRKLMDYAELELAALRALGEEDAPTDLQLMLDQKMRHILVDEFQDTSRNQWELLLRLCGGWTPGDGRTVFIVGDPKQSIYGFRKAEVALFMDAKKGLPIPGQDCLPLIPLTLSTNFRSQRRLIDFTNRIFGQVIMVDPDLDVEEVPYVEAWPCPGNEAGGEISLAVFSKEEQTDARLREARWLAQQVKKTINSWPGASIGILLPVRNRLSEYLEALSQEGLQVQVREGTVLKECPEIIDLLSLTRALVRPHDDLAWASLLRSVWCWVGLDTLLQISHEKPDNWSGKIRNFAAALAAPPQMKTLWNAIDQHSIGIGRESLVSMVSAIWEEAGGPGAVAASFGPAGVENCRRFFGILAEVETGIPEETLIRLERRMDTAYAPPDPLAARSAVQIMTIHRAKGLEFDIVFLPQLDWDPWSGSRNESPPYLLERLPGLGGKRLIALRPDKRLKKGSKIYDLLRKIQKQRHLGESKRLFYVAATRARRQLHLSGVVSRQKGDLLAPANSFLRYILSDQAAFCGVSCLEDPEIEIPGPLSALQDIQNLPEPLPFEPEKLPFQIISPSKLHGEITGDESARPSSGERDNAYLLARGTVIHRLLERLSKGGELPTPRAVTLSLAAEGVEYETARQSGGDVLSEVSACRNEEFCSFILRSDHSFAASELAIEDHPREGMVRSGIIDRVICDGNSWWIVDYKTTPVPCGMDIQKFLESEAEYYREQLLAYRDMLMNKLDIEADKIRPFLYFTALQKAHQVT